MKLIVADASPLIVIARSGLIPTLVAVVGEVVVPEAVFAECTGDDTKPGAAAIRAAAAAGIIGCRPAPDDQGLPETEFLGAGERAAIALARLLACPALMDDRLGRQAARQAGLQVVGSAGFLLMAQEQHLIPAVAPILDDWKRFGYFLSDAIVQAILARAGEI